MRRITTNKITIVTEGNRILIISMLIKNDYPFSLTFSGQAKFSKLSPMTIEELL